jgi:translation initiation factor 2 alpha subunit (eIF-2alpha)
MGNNVPANGQINITDTKQENLKAMIDTEEITIGEIYHIKKLLGLGNEELCKLIKI